MSEATNSTTPAQGLEHLGNNVAEVRAQVSNSQRVSLGLLVIALSPCLKIWAFICGFLRYLRSSFLVKGKQRGLLFLAIITVLYLMSEFAFSAWLIDVLAADSTPEEIQRVEHYGRLISGFAVALLLWPWVLRATKVSIASIVGLILVTAPIMFVVYHAERVLIDRLVQYSSDEGRAAAVSGSFLREAIMKGAINGEMLNGLWQPELANTTSGRAFIGVVAFMTASSNDAIKQTKALAPGLAREIIGKNLGGVTGEFERFSESQHAISEKFDAYQAAHERYNAEISKVDARSAQAWEQYLDGLEQRHKYWGRYLIKNPRKDGHIVPAKYAQSVRDQLGFQGIQVPKTWATGDKKGFLRYAKQSITSTLQKEILGGLPPNLSLSEFADQKIVQDNWRISLQYPQAVGKLPHEKMTESEFGSRIYEKVLTHRVEQQLRVLNREAEDYGRGGWEEEKGLAAYEAMIAPVFALTLSLIGALVHILKSAFLIFQVKTGWHFKSGEAKTVCILLCVIGTFFVASAIIKTEITSHPTYKQWNSIRSDIDWMDKKSVAAHTAAGALDAMIKLQTVAYPVFNAVRVVMSPAFLLIEKSGLDEYAFNPKDED